MAQVNIQVGGIEVGIEDEDKGHKAIAKLAREIVLELIDKVAVEPDDEEG